MRRGGTKIARSLVLVLMIAALMLQGCGIHKAGDAASSGQSGQPAGSGSEDGAGGSGSGSGEETGGSGGTEQDSSSDQDKPQELTREQRIRLQARKILDSMTTEEKVDQMFVLSPEMLTGVGTVVQAGETTRKALEEHPVGGLLYSKPNMTGTDQTKQMIADTQSFSKYGLLICVDEEGGNVARVEDSLGTTHFEPMYTYREQGRKTARANARTIGTDISGLGFNTDFAPVADVWSNPDNSVIGKRAYSDDYAQAARLVPAAVKGFHDSGVICCLKHFPGHGDTNEDSHTSAAYTDKTRKELAAQEWTVFKAGIDAGADMVMVGHVTAGKIDDKPATFSKKLVTGALRKKLGFGGVVITDSLSMGAVTQQYTAGQAAVQAVQAGADILLEPADFAQAEEALMQAVQDGLISGKRIDRSVMRIIQMKIRRGVITDS